MEVEYGMASREEQSKMFSCARLAWLYAQPTLDKAQSAVDWICRNFPANYLCNSIFKRKKRTGRRQDWSVIHAAVHLFCRTHARITPPESDAKGLRAAVCGAPMNDSLAAALDIHPRRRYTAHKVAVR